MFNFTYTKYLPYVYRQLPPVHGQWLAGGAGSGLRLLREDAIMINCHICAHFNHTPLFIKNTFNFFVDT